MSNAKTRNGAIDLLRLLFCFGIVIRHAVYVLPKNTSFILERGGLCVEFFFIVSGYLMVCSAAHYLNGPSVLSTGMATAKYIKRKVNSLMPNMLIAAVLSFLVL